MSNIIRLKIDVTKIDKARLFKGKVNAKTGKTPMYLDCTLVPLREVGPYGDTHLISQDVTKEEREAGTKGNIIGNGKELEPRQDQRKPAPTTRRSAPSAESQTAPEDDDVPF